MEIFGNNIGKEDLIKRIGDISQLGGLKQYEFTDGMRKGVAAIDIKSPCGIDMTVVLDRAMDISYLSYKSIPISWRSSTRETSPMYYESKGIEFLRTFYGGLLTTCGLTSIGLPSIDEGEELGLHGRISNSAAENVCYGGEWENDSYKMWVSGRVRESRLFGDKLELIRKITIWMDKPKILIEDSIVNIGPRISPIMILYHINIGYPVLDKFSKILESKSKVTPMNEEARNTSRKYSEFSGPVPGFKEQLFLHDIEADNEGNSKVAIINEDFDNKKGIGISMKVNKDNLPYLLEWKNLDEIDYVCGIEPCNSFIRGRKVEREEGNLRFIEPGENINYRIELNILASNNDIEIFKNLIK